MASSWSHCYTLHTRPSPSPGTCGREQMLRWQDCAVLLEKKDYCLSSFDVETEKSYLLVKCEAIFWGGCRGIMVANDDFNSLYFTPPSLLKNRKQ